MTFSKDCMHRPKRPSERSFTLIETVVALSLITFLVVEVAAVQGNSVVFAEYNRNITQASWLARRVMSQIEYLYRTKPFPDLIKEVRDARFEEVSDYTYSIDIKEWKFPFIQLLQSTVGGGKGGDDPEDNTRAERAKNSDKGIAQVLEQVVDQVFGKEPIFLTAQVSVHWPEGAARGGTQLMYLLTNQAKLDEAIALMRPTWEQCIKSQQEKSKNKKESSNNSSKGSGTGGGSPESGENPNPDGTGMPPPG